MTIAAVVTVVCAPLFSFLHRAGRVRLDVPTVFLLRNVTVIRAGLVFVRVQVEENRSMGETLRICQSIFPSGTLRRPELNRAMQPGYRM